MVLLNNILDLIIYDLDAGENKFEVKTSEDNSIIFCMTSNQLKTANKLTNKYNLFYINIDNTKQLITGFIINNPIQILNLNNFDIHYSENTNVNIMPSAFTISLNAFFIHENFKWITLNNYIFKYTYFQLLLHVHKFYLSQYQLFQL